MKVSFVLLASTCIVLASAANEFEGVYTDEFVVQVNACDWPEVQHELDRMGARFIKKIPPDFYLYKDHRIDSNTEKLPSKLNGYVFLQTKIRYFEKIRAFTMDSFDGHFSFDGHVIAAAVSSTGNLLFSIPVAKNCPTFSDMGVEAVWKMGYTGKGIVIAITDAGINTDIKDLQPNIKTELSYNYAGNNADVTPDRCYISEHYNSLSDHGNNCAGIIGASRNNKECGDGIAFQADLVAVKIFSIVEQQMYGKCHIYCDTSWMAQGLLHAIEDVDVYSNSWAPVDDFLHSSELAKNALQTGVQRGRNGKGAIYVFPVGPLADPFSNSVYTIAVNSVTGSGNVSDFSQMCACTLTSAYGQPSKKRSHVTIVLQYTTSNYRGKCTLDFEGTSASTAIVSGIIGLALHANPALRWRDIQDLIVQASESRSLVNKNEFVRNGAGRKFHHTLGFGLLNASKFVKLAKREKSLPEQLIVTKQAFLLTRSRNHYNPLVECTIHAHIDVSCNTTCINRTESVLVDIKYASLFEYHSDVILTSPSGTDSRLMNRRNDMYNASTYRYKSILLKSVNFWGENAVGRWTLTFQNSVNQGEIRLEMFKLIIFGTGYQQKSTPSDSSHSGQEHGPRNSNVDLDETTSSQETPANKGDGYSVWFMIVGLLLGVLGLIRIALAFELFI